MALQGAELLLYPTAIGSEPARPDLDTMEHWRMVMRGHAAANMIPVAAANRIGSELIGGTSQSYYGSSFISGPDGQLLASAARDKEELLIARFDRQALADDRAAWGLFRDRRPELYATLATADGEQTL
jgi:N-carbamoylputrescine amidase